MYIAPANIGSWGLNYKTLRARNLRKMDRFRSKVVPFRLLVFFNGLHKHNSLLRNL